MQTRRYKVSVPEGSSGDWFIRKFSVSQIEANIFNLRAGRRYILPGDYTALYRKGEHDPIMSDTPAEVSDHSSLFHNASGNVLINGFGLGMAVQGCLNKPEVGNVTVIEISEDVINLVGDHYMSLFPDRLKIIHADAMEWKPPRGTRYGAVWHDIWNTICADNHKEMKILHRRYGRRCDWQESWCRWEVRKLVRDEKAFFKGIRTAY